ARNIVSGARFATRFRAQSIRNGLQRYFQSPFDMFLNAQPPGAARRTPSSGAPSSRLLRGGLRSRLGFSAALFKQDGAPRGDGEANLVERQRKRYLRRLVVMVVFALMQDGDQEIVGIDLQLIERLQGGRGMRLAYDVDETLQQPQPPG